MARIGFLTVALVALEARLLLAADYSVRSEKTPPPSQLAEAVAKKKGRLPPQR